MELNAKSVHLQNVKSASVLTYFYSQAVLTPALTDTIQTGFNALNATQIVKDVQEADIPNAHPAKQVWNL